MLPSMPILFTRESQDAFGNKIEPSTSFFSQSLAPKQANKLETPPETVQDPPKVQTETNNKNESEKKKKDPPNIDHIALEDALVKSYYMRVQSRFSTNASVPTNKFVQFQNILINFDPNKETPVDLYKKVEQLFGKDSELAEDFLMFLKPGQALQVGRFMDKLMLSQITCFIEQLNQTFKRKPTVLRKVIRAITMGLNSGNSAEVKARVLPHFRSHPRLTEMFRMLLPDERPPDCLYSTGTDHVTESMLVSDKGYDVWSLDRDDDKKQKAKSGLDIMYLNGRVFLQHGRYLRSARVTFPYSKEPYRVHARRLAPSHCHLPSPHTHPQKNKNIPQKRPRKQKSPTKKDVNDNTKKESIMSPKPRKAQKTKNGKKEPEKQVRKKDSKINNEKDKISSVIKKEASELTADSANAKTEMTAESASVKTEITAEPSRAKLAKLGNDDTKDSKSNNWTRDEDKTMLQVLKGEAGSETVFGRIRELLPHRSPIEIKERFCHVMTLLQQMAVGQVT